MKKDSFFDTNIIINYASYYSGSKSPISKKCFLYIRNKIAKFIICCFVEKEIFNFIKNRSILHKEVLRKIEDNGYLFEDSKLLSKRDIPYAKKLCAVYKNQDLETVSKAFSEERKELGIKIEQFFKTKLDETVIPEEQISVELTNIIHDIIPNRADCKIVASALQLREERKEDFLFVTADTKDLDPNGYDYLKDNSKLKNYEFPELLNLLYVD